MKSFLFGSFKSAMLTACLMAFWVLPQASKAQVADFATFSQQFPTAEMPYATPNSWPDLIGDYPEEDHELYQKELSMELVKKYYDEHSRGEFLYPVAKIPYGNITGLVYYVLNSNGFAGSTQHRYDIIFYDSEGNPGAIQTLANMRNDLDYQDSYEIFNSTQSSSTIEEYDMGQIVIHRTIDESSRITENFGQSVTVTSDMYYTLTPTNGWEEKTIRLNR